MTIKQLQKLCHQIAVEKGFWDFCYECNGIGQIEIKYWDSGSPILKTGELRLKISKCKFRKYKEICQFCNGKGYYINRNNGELIALMHSELSEALEELRKKDYDMQLVGEELADCVIRILDFCGGRCINLEKLLEKKIKKNKKRSYKHGKRF